MAIEKSKRNGEKEKEKWTTVVWKSIMRAEYETGAKCVSSCVKRRLRNYIAQSDFSQNRVQERMQSRSEHLNRSNRVVSYASQLAAVSSSSRQI